MGLRPKTSVSSNTISEKLRTSRRAYASPSSRILTKYGQYNVLTHNIPDKETRYIKDLGNTLLNIRWRWIILTICVTHAIFYVIYGYCWMLIGLIYDVDNNTPCCPCVTNVNSFTSYLILSIETLSTRGNGDTQPGDCQANWMLMTVQVVTQIVLDGAFVTAVFVRLSRSRNKHPVRLFSRQAVVSMRDGVLCLIFRIRDIDGRHLAKTTIKAVLVRRKCNEFYFENLKLEPHGLLIWPQDVIHNITCESPLWALTPLDLDRTKFEIMIFLEGDSRSIGEPSRSQTSYTNREIVWGYRFVPCIDYDAKCQKYVVDHKKFGQIVEYDTPFCSAQALNSSSIVDLTPKSTVGDPSTLTSSDNENFIESTLEL